MREILVEWTGPQGSFLRSVMYFASAGTAGPSEQRQALGTALNLIMTAGSNRYRATVLTTGRELNETTGALVGEWSEPTPRSYLGQANTEPAADALQGLVRWQTGVIVNGRFLRGRTFIPGIPASQWSGGNLSAAFQTTLASFASSLVLADVGFGVWHRPKNSSGGEFHPASGYTVWTEGAVLRRRRA